VTNRVKISVEPLIERARMLRRDAARLVRQLGKTSEQIKALTRAPRPDNGKASRAGAPRQDKPR